MSESILELLKMVGKLNYDDFYKFKTSMGVIFFILGIVGANLIIFYFSWEKVWFLGFGILFHLIVASTGVYYFNQALNGWEKNQKEFDKKIETETEVARIKAKKEKIELAIAEKNFAAIKEGYRGR